MKQSIQWHEQCISSMNRGITIKMHQIAKLQGELRLDQSESLVYQMQIDRAYKLGKDGFDHEKFNPLPQ